MTECSLNLFVEHLPENNTVNDAEEVDDYEENPDVIVITASNNREAQIEHISHKKREAYAAKKLFLVMAGFLFCWLPYFLWLPFSTLLVNILGISLSL